MNFKRISEETQYNLNIMMQEMKKSGKLMNTEVEEIELLKIKRRSITRKIEDIEARYPRNIVVPEKYAWLKKQYDLDLEILKKTHNIESRKLYLRRLQYLNLMLQFKESDNHIYINEYDISIKVLYERFLENIISENIEYLHFRQQVIRLTVLYNRNVGDNEELHISSGDEDNLYSIQNKIEESKNREVDYSKVDFSRLTAEDLLLTDSIKLYDKLVMDGKTKK